MKEKSLINILYLTMRNEFDSFNSTPEVACIVNRLIEAERKLRGAIENLPEIKILYNLFEEIDSKYLSMIENNAFNYGFKLGIKLALECDLFHAQTE